MNVCYICDMCLYDVMRMIMSSKGDGQEYYIILATCSLICYITAVAAQQQPSKVAYVIIMMISLLVDDDDNIHINLHTMYLFVALVYYTPSTLHFFEMTKTDKKDESKVKGCFA